MSKAEIETIAAIADGIPSLVKARSVVDTFQSLTRKTTENELDVSIERAKISLVVSSANSVKKIKRPSPAPSHPLGPIDKPRGKSLS